MNGIDSSVGRDALLTVVVYVRTYVDYKGPASMHITALSKATQ